MNNEEIITLSSDEESEHINNNQAIVKINPKALQLLASQTCKRNKAGLFDRYCVKLNKYLNNSPQISMNDAVKSDESVFVKEKNGIISKVNSKTGSDVMIESEFSEFQDKSQDITGNSFYDNFVQKCISFEPEPTDKVRLQNKLIKRYKEANPDYATSDEFKKIIDKCVIKLNSKNVYFFAKEVADELCSRKKIVSALQNSGNQKRNNISYNDEENELDSSKFKYKNKKQKRLIKKILKQLNMLGSKIRELEMAEVDLSDEEESSYVQLQRYRYRFCLVYKQLCKLTKEVSDANRVFSRRICFSGSKYPEINKSIEKWLNETQRFPDFKDIFTLLESQSSSLGLPSDDDSLRAIATDIFQKVGVMLQRRRKYDLWDSFCSYLDEHEDPASKDPELESSLKKNYETRVIKEKEILAHFAKLQEKERIKPVEVSDKEALESPSESGNEEEREIEAIEESINKKLDIFIDKVGENISSDNAECDKKFDFIEIDDSDCITEETESTDDSKVSKESKNNYKNCKSLKWRNENQAKCRVENFGANLKMSSVLSDHSYNNTNVIEETVEKSEGDKECGVTRITTMTVAPDFNSGGYITKKNVTSLPVKRLPNPLNSTNVDLCLPSAKKSKLMDCQSRESSTSIIHESKKCRKTECSFEVRYCHVEYSFRNFCKVNYEKNLDGENKRNKIVKDLANIRKILDCKGIKRKGSRFPSCFLYQWNDNSLKKLSWGKRYTYPHHSGSRSNGKRCAVNQEEKTAKNMKNVQRNSNDKNVDNDSQGQGNETCGFGSGSGNERDNNENDENKKNGKKAENEAGECRNEEEDDDKEEENESEKNGEEPLKPESATPSKISEAKTPSMKEGSTQSKLPSGRGRKKRQVKSKNVPEPPKPTRINRRGHWKRRTSLVTAETAVGGDIVKAVVTLNENSGFFSSDGERGRLDYNDFPKFDPLRPYDCVEERQVERSTCLQERGSKKRNQETKPSDEERVKRFLLNSPSSISITPPRRLSTKPPSQEVLQALATLKKLKGISTTRVVRKPDVEDDVIVIAESKTPEKGVSKAKNRKSETLPTSKAPPAAASKAETVISAVPKIVGVQGSVIGFEFKTPKKRSDVSRRSETSTLRISNVWGNCNSFVGNNEGEPSCSYAQVNGEMSGSPKGKKSKKSVEYVVLD